MKHFFLSIAVIFGLIVSLSAVAGECPNFTKYDPAGDSFCYTEVPVTINLPNQANIIDYDRVTYLQCSLYSSQKKYASDGSILYVGGSPVKVSKGGSATLEACKDPNKCVGWSNLSVGKLVHCGSNTFFPASGTENPVYYRVDCAYASSISLDKCMWLMLPK